MTYGCLYGIDFIHMTDKIYEGLMWIIVYCKQ